MSPVNQQNPLNRKLTRYALGVGALAAGSALPQKADADIIFSSFSGGITHPYAVHVGFDGNTGLIASGGEFFPAFNFNLRTTFESSSSGFLLYASLYGGPSYTYRALVLAPTASGYYDEFLPRITAPRTDVDLSSLSTSYQWAYGGDLAFPDPGVSYFIGLRKDTSGGTYYGWAELEVASVTLKSAAFNDTPGAPLTLGQIPEPSSLLLLTGGALGLATLRKRRKQAKVPA